MGGLWVHCGLVIGTVSVIGVVIAEVSGEEEV